MKDYRLLVKNINEILDKYDPVNIHAPASEYDMEARAIASKIHECESISEVQDLIYRIFVEYFDEGTVGDKQKYRNIAEVIYQRVTN